MEPVLNRSAKAVEAAREETRLEISADGFRLGYRPALDGVRGLAVLFVICAHGYVLPRTFGFIGVEVFFALSGFLITSLLVEEWRESGRINWRAFYARRALRLLPALFAMLAAYLVFAALQGQPHFLRHALIETLCALFYCTNLGQAYDDYYFRFLRHTWSLSVEEQFYLVWPALLFWMLRRGARGSTASSIARVAVGFWVARVVLYLGAIIFFYHITNETLLANILHPEALLLGCVAALALEFNLLRPLPTPRLEMMLRSGFAISFGGIALIGFCCQIGDSFMICVGWMLTSVFSAIVVLKMAVFPGALAGSIFEHPILVYTGKLSYGLYLWNSVVFEAISWRHHWPHWKFTMVGVCGTVLAAILSYRLIELPCLRFKRRFQTTSSARPMPAR